MSPCVAAHVRCFASACLLTKACYVFDYKLFLQRAPLSATPHR